MVKLSPSILSADFGKLDEQIKRIDKAGAEFVHIDVMDGHFVPNISFGAPILKSVRKSTRRILDVHLMIDEPSKFIDDFIESGADLITVHYEADKHIDRTINYIKSKGIKAGIALNPGTPVSVLEDLIGIVDMVLIMTVNPGFGGQKFIPYSIDKIKKVRELAQNKKVDILIEVDGGITSTNASDVIRAGADVLVAGSAVFCNDDIEKNISSFKKVF